MVPAPAQGHPQYSGEERLTHAVARPLQSRFRRRSVAIPGDMSVDISPPPSATEVCGRIDRNSLRLLLIDLPRLTGTGRRFSSWRSCLDRGDVVSPLHAADASDAVVDLWSWAPRSPNMSPRRLRRSPQSLRHLGYLLAAAAGGGDNRMRLRRRHRWLSARSWR